MPATHISVSSASKQTIPSYSRIKKFQTNVSVLTNFIPKSLQRTCEPEIRRPKTVLGNPPRSYLIRVKASRQTSQQNLAWRLEAARLILRAQVTDTESRPLTASGSVQRHMGGCSIFEARWCSESPGRPSAWDSSALRPSGS